MLYDVILTWQRLNVCVSVCGGGGFTVVWCLFLIEKVWRWQLVTRISAIQLISSCTHRSSCLIRPWFEVVWNFGAGRSIIAACRADFVIGRVSLCVCFVQVSARRRNLFVFCEFLPHNFTRDAPTVPMGRALCARLRPLGGGIKCFMREPWELRPRLSAKLEAQMRRGTLIMAFLTFLCGCWGLSVSAHVPQRRAACSPRKKWQLPFPPASRP